MKAVTVPREGVQRRAPAGASPTWTRSTMLSEQNGAYGGHLDPLFVRLAEREGARLLTRADSWWAP